MPTLAEFLKKEMAEKHLSQSDLARQIGVYPDYVRRWISGDVPKPDKCAQIAEALGMPVSAIMQMAGYPGDTGVLSDDPEKEQALRLFERILDETARRHWYKLARLARASAEVLNDEPQGDSDDNPKVEIIHRASGLEHERGESASLSAARMRRSAHAGTAVMLPA